VTVGVGWQLRRPGTALRRTWAAPVDVSSSVPSLRESLRACWLPWLASRVVTAVAVVACISRVWSNFELHYRGFVMWDFGWYYRIAIGGYGPRPISGAQSPWPFFPLFPGVLKAGTEAGIDIRIWAVVVNHIVFLVALAGVHRVVTSTAGPRPGRYAVWAVAFFPGAFIFSMGYPSAIFLAASVWAFALAAEGHDLGAGLCAAVAALVRPNGLLVALALAAGVLVRRSPARPDPVRALRLAGPAFLAFAVWLGFLWHWTGDALVFVHAKQAWDEITVVEVVRQHMKWPLPHLVLGVAAIVAIGLGRKLVPWPWVLFGVLYLAPPLALGVVGLARYSAECFVPFVTAGSLLARWPRTLSATLLLLSAAGCAAYAVWVVRYLWVP
jgi:hypothetical protein